MDYDLYPGWLQESSGASWSKKLTSALRDSSDMQELTPLGCGQKASHGEDENDNKVQLSSRGAASPAADEAECRSSAGRM